MITMLHRIHWTQQDKEQDKTLKSPQRVATEPHKAQTYQNISKTRLLNILKFSPPKKENFQIKSDIFHISAQNIDCWYSLEPPQRGRSNEFPKSMF